MVNYLMAVTENTNDGGGDDDDDGDDTNTNNVAHSHHTDLVATNSLAMCWNEINNGR